MSPKRLRAPTRSRGAAPKLSESATEAAVVRLLKGAGCEVYRVSGAFGNQRGGTRLTAGLADCTVFLPFSTRPWDVHTCPEYGASPCAACARQQRPPLGYFETKTPAGLKEHQRLAPLDRPPTPSQFRAWKKVRAQALFAQRCRDRAIPYAMGGMDEAWAFLASVGLADQTNGLWHLRRNK